MKAGDLNRQIASRLDEVAFLLEQQGANRFRVQAYRDAATTLYRLDRPVDEILASDGVAGLDDLPTIGTTIARAIQDLVTTGRLPILDRLRGESDPHSILKSVPGIGDTLAEFLHHDLGIGTLEDLEVAAYDGRLANVGGIGAKRLESIRDSLAARLGRVRAQLTAIAAQDDEPSVRELLDVDREYREKASTGQLRLIAPRRFNPTRARWLPILHTHRGERHYTALYSNTARAHQLGRTRDWVVLYCDGRARERQYTVITSHRGALEGKRIVRGREAECVEHYAEPAGI